MAESTLLSQLRNASDFLGIELKDALKDKGVLNVLVSYLADYGSLFRKGAAFVRSLPHDRAICILLDCDVIYAYLHPEKMKPDQTLLARWLFEDSKLKYAIPSGAYKELLSHLSESFGLPPQPIPKREFRNPMAAVMARLGISPESSQDPAVINAVESTTDERVMRLDRLLRILENKDRFYGVLSRYDNETKEYATQLVSQKREDAYERISHLSLGSSHAMLPHDKNDARDGENLAIALNSQYKSQQNIHFVLVTMTRPVLDAAKVLFRSKASSGAWFAVMPMELLVPARLGFGDSDRRHQVRVQLSNLQYEVDSLMAKYNDVLDEINAGSRPSEYRIKQLEVESRAALNELAIHDIKRIESACQPIVFARMAAGDLMQGRGGGDFAANHVRFTAYLRLLERVRNTIQQLEGIEYTVQSHESPSPEQLKMVSIGSQDLENEFMRIDVFEVDGDLHLWCAQWDLDVNERSFFDAIEEFYPAQKHIRSSGEIDATFEIDPPSHSQLWHAGIVLSNGYSSFGIDLNAALADGSWSDVTLAQLRDIVLENTMDAQIELKTFWDFEESGQFAGGVATLARDRVKSIPAFSPKDHIVEVRVNLPDVDLVFEIVPPEGQLKQRFTMISSKPIYKAVAHFYDWLGVRIAVMRELEKVVERVLAPYFQ